MLSLSEIYNGITPAYQLKVLLEEFPAEPRLSVQEIAAIVFKYQSIDQLYEDGWENISHKLNCEIFRAKQIWVWAQTCVSNQIQVRE